MGAPEIGGAVPKRPKQVDCLMAPTSANPGEYSGRSDYLAPCGWRKQCSENHIRLR